MDADLISIVNKLQNTFSTIGAESVDLPQIVTVGSQSSGKSSVLENIVGKDFLPRGQGIVTRRPLVLQLVHAPEGPEYGEFLHLDRRFTDFNDIRREIEAETLRVAGANKGVSRLPIHLKVHSPNVLNLTLVDLPGLTKIPVGDQPSDIERQIRTLVLEFIAQPNCVILAVSPANVDLANSEALQLARQVDPAGRRTLGVLTKLDLMDSGTHALDVLSGTVYPLRLGFVGVVNRSQSDINSHKDLSAQLAAEAAFFASHPAYRAIAHRCGTPYLARTLNSVLLAHIRERLPDMKARINTLMGQAQQALTALGGAGASGAPGPLILRLITRFAAAFTAAVDGTAASTHELCGGARIYVLFHDVFGRSLAGLDPVQSLSSSDIRTAIRNATGPRPSLFVPELAFELLVTPQIALLAPPAQRCVELVYEELMKICHACARRDLERYPRLHAQLIETVSELLRERLGPTSDYVRSLVDIQTAYINTNHAGFVAASQGAAEEAARTVRARRNKVAVSSSSDDDTNSESTALELHARGTRTKTTGGKEAKSPLLSSGPLGGGLSGGLGGLGNGTSNGTASTNGKDAKSLSSAFSLAGSIGQTPGKSVTQTTSTKDTFLSSFFGAETVTTSVTTTKLEHLNIDDGPAEEDLSEREEIETELIIRLITNYFDITRQTILDLVPKAVMHLLVNHTRDEVQNRLVESLYKESLFKDLMYEDEALTSERARITELLSAYKEAFATLSEVL